MKLIQILYIIYYININILYITYNIMNILHLMFILNLLYLIKWMESTIQYVIFPRKTRIFSFNLLAGLLCENWTKGSHSERILKYLLTFLLCSWEPNKYQSHYQLSMSWADRSLLPWALGTGAWLGHQRPGPCSGFITGAGATPKVMLIPAFLTNRILTLLRWPVTICWRKVGSDLEGAS